MAQDCLPCHVRNDSLHALRHLSRFLAMRREGDKFLIDTDPGPQRPPTTKATRRRQNGIHVLGMFSSVMIWNLHNRVFGRHSLPSAILDAALQRSLYSQAVSFEKAAR